MPTRAGGGGRRVTKRQKRSAVAAVGNIFGGAAKKTGKKAAAPKAAVASSVPRPPRRQPLPIRAILGTTFQGPTKTVGNPLSDLLHSTTSGLSSDFRQLTGQEAPHYVLPAIEKNPAFQSVQLATGGEGVLSKASSLASAAQEARKASKVAQQASRADRAAQQASRPARAGQAVRNAPKAAAKKVGGAAGKSRPARAVAKSRPVQAAAKAARSPAGRAAGKGLRVGGKVAKQPFTKKGLVAGPIAAQVPAAAISGDPKQLTKALSGTGTYATIVSKIGGVASSAAPGSVAKNIVRDTFNLPAQALPSIYLPLAGVVEASQGDPGRLNKLWDSYKKSGFLPAVASGDPSKVLKAFERHPLFSALEVSGAYAGAGRGVGALGRRAGAFKEDRAPLHVYGNVKQERTYSANAFTQMAQKARARRVLRKGAEERAKIDKEIQIQEASKVGAQPHERALIHDRILKLEQAKHETRHPNVATKKQAERYLQGTRMAEGARRDPIARVDRHVDLNEQVRRINRQEALHQRDVARPSHNENIVSEIAQRSIRRPDTFHQDLHSRAAEIQHELGMNPDLTPGQRESGAMLLKDIGKALKLKPDDPKIAELFHSAQLFIDQHEPAVQQAIKLGIRDRKEVAQIRGTPYAMRHMGATYGRTRAVETQLGHLDERISAAERTNQHEIAQSLRAEKRQLKSNNKPQWLNSKGEPLTSEAVNAHMAANGVEPAGFITHRPGFRGGRNFYQPSDSAARGATPARTGQAFRAGAYDHSYEALREQHAHTQTVVDRNANFFRTLKEYGLRQPDGSYFKTYREADAAANEPGAFGIHLPSNVGPFRPVAIHEFLALKRELAAARDHAEGGLLSPDNHESLRQHEANLLDEATKDQGTGRYVLVPQQVLERLGAHQLKNTELDKFLQAYTSGFKSTVLPLSPKWLIGNVVDTNILRGGLLAGAGPFDYFLGRRMLKHIQQTNPELYKRIEGGILTGAHYASKEQVDMYRQAAVPVHRAWQRFTQAPGISTLGAGYRTYANSVFRLNGWLERQPQFATFGKELRRDWRDTTGQWHHALQLGDGALEDLAKGLTNTDKQIRYAHAVEDVFGRWGKNSPEARRLLTTYAPFYMWARAASRLVLLTLPIKHPIKTGLLAAASDMSSDEEKKLGLDVLGKNRVVGFLQGAIPTKSGGLIPTQQYTSFGIFGDPANTAANFVLPQFSGLGILQGFAFAGQQLVNNDGTPMNPLQLVGLAAYNQASATLPLLSLGQRLMEGGASAKPGSTIFAPKTTTPGSGILGGLERWALPRVESPSTVKYLRGLSQSRQITVPAHPKGSSGGDYSQYFTPSSSSSSGTTTDYSKYFKGG